MVVLLNAGAIAVAAPPKGPFPDGKTGGSDADMRQRLEELATRTEQTRKGTPPKPGAPAPGPVPPTTGMPQAPASPPAAPPMEQGGMALFEEDFDKAGAVSYTQQRAVLLVFTPKLFIDSWRHERQLQSWAQRALICPIHAESMGSRALRLAEAFGVDPIRGGMLTALVRAPDGVKQVMPGQLLYQVLGRFPPAQDVSEVINALQQGISAYEMKRSLYSWDATVSQPVTPSPEPPAGNAPVPPPSSGTPMPQPQPPSTDATPPPAAKPQEAPLSAFEKTILKAWQNRKPVLLIFPGDAPFDEAQVAGELGALPLTLTPEHLLLQPADPEGSVAGKPMNWEEFFHVDGAYPHAVMMMPENPDGVARPKVADMTYRVIARQHGDVSPDTVATLVKRWMSEDFDAVTMRAWVTRRPMLLVFPHAENDRQLLDSPELAELEGKVAVYVNTKSAVSGIRRKSADQLAKDLATEGVERPELVLVKVENPKKSAAGIRLDDLTHRPVNRAFAKKSPDKVLEWVNSRVPAKAGASGAPQ